MGMINTQANDRCSFRLNQVMSTLITLFSTSYFNHCFILNFRILNFSRKTSTTVSFTREHRLIFNHYPVESWKSSWAQTLWMNQMLKNFSRLIPELCRSLFIKNLTFTATFRWLSQPARIRPIIDQSVSHLKRSSAFQTIFPLSFIRCKLL